MIVENRYTELFNELQKRLKQLKKKLDQHKKGFIQNPNWSFVGDIQYVNEQLKLIVEFMK